MKNKGGLRPPKPARFYHGTKAWQKYFSSTARRR